MLPSGLGISGLYIWLISPTPVNRRTSSANREVPALLCRYCGVSSRGHSTGPVKFVCLPTEVDSRALLHPCCGFAAASPRSGNKSCHFLFGCATALPAECHYTAGLYCPAHRLAPPLL